jgi:hypothetical protein
VRAPNELAFVLRGAGQDVRGEAAGGVRGVNVPTEEHHAPAAATGAVKQAGEVGDGSADAIEADREEEVGVAGIEASEGGLQRGPVQGLGRDPLVGDEFEVPSAAGGFCGERRSLRVAAGFVLDLLGGGDADVSIPTVNVPSGHHLAVIEEFGATVRSGEWASAYGDYALHRSRVIDAVYASAAKHREVGVEHGSPTPSGAQLWPEVSVAQAQNPLRSARSRGSEGVCHLRWRWDLNPRMV